MEIIIPLYYYWSSEASILARPRENSPSYSSAGPGTDYWLLITDDWLLTTDYWLLTTDCWLLTTDYWLLTIDYWLLTTDYWLLTTDYWLLIIDYWLLTTDCWLLTTDYWLLTTDYWLLTTDGSIKVVVIIRHSGWENKITIAHKSISWYETYYSQQRQPLSFISGIQQIARQRALIYSIKLAFITTFLSPKIFRWGDHLQCSFIPFEWFAEYKTGQRVDSVFLRFIARIFPPFPRDISDVGFRVGPYYCGARPPEIFLDFRNQTKYFHLYFDCIAFSIGSMVSSSSGSASSITMGAFLVFPLLSTIMRVSCLEVLDVLV